MHDLMFFFGLLVLCLPFVALALALSARGKAVEALRQLKELRGEMRAGKLGAPENFPGEGGGRGHGPPELPPVMLPPPPLPMPVGRRSEESGRDVRGQLAGAKELAAEEIPIGVRGEVRQEKFSGKKAIEWEQFLGTKLIAWVGGFALFLGLVYLTIESFQRGWIPPWVRVLGGGILGLGLVGGGVCFRNTVYRTTMQTLTGTGVVTLFAVIYACRGFYHFPLFTPAVTFGLLLGLTVAAFSLAGLMRAQVVAALGLLAGFFTPVLVSTGNDSPGGLFGYLTLLTVGVLGCSGRLNWRWLPPLAGLGFAVLYFGWIVRYVWPYGSVYAARPEVLIPLVVAGGFPLLHLGGTLLCGASGPRRTMAWTATGLSVLALLAGVDALARLQEPLALGFLLFAGVPPLAVAWKERGTALVLPGLALLTALGLGVWIVSPDEWPSWLVLPVLVAYGVIHGIVPLVLAQGKLREVSPRHSGVIAVAGLGACLMPYLLLALAAGLISLPDPTTIFCTLTFLGLLLAGALHGLRRPCLQWIGLLGTLLVEGIWMVANWPGASVWLVFGWSLGLGLFWLAVPLARWREWLAARGIWGAAALSLPLHYPLLRCGAEEIFPAQAPGLLALLLALPVAGAGWLLAKNLPEENGAARSRLLAWLGGVALFFVTLALGEQLERQWLTVAWTLEAVALCGLMRKVPHRGLSGVALGLLATVFFRLSVGAEELVAAWGSGWPVWNVYLYVYGVAIGGFLAVAWLLARAEESLRWHQQVPGLLRGGAVLLAFILVNMEIADYFAVNAGGNPWEVFVARDAEAFARGMSFTLAWGAFALALVVVGMWRRIPLARYAGLALLGVTLLKLFVADLASLANLYRIAALIGTALMAIGASLIYQRFLREEKVPDEKG